MNDGMLIDENVLMMAEALSKSDQELQTNFAAISTCSSRSKYQSNIIKLNFLLPSFAFSGGMDECDTAAIIYQCGQEQVPDFMTNIINAVELNSSSVSLNIFLFFKAIILSTKTLFNCKESVPLPATAPFCILDYECIIEVSFFFIEKIEC